MDSWHAGNMNLWSPEKVLWVSLLALTCYSPLKYSLKESGYWLFTPTSLCIAVVRQELSPTQAIQN
jgi:hypothetical protein